MNMAKAVTFPLPLLNIANQQLIQASSSNYGDIASASPLKIWEQMFGVNVRDAANQKSYNPGHLAEQLSMTSKAVKRIGFIGLGAMGFGMVYKPTLNRFADLGGIVGSSPEEVAKDVEVLIIMVANEAQAESVLYGNAGSVFALSEKLYVIEGGCGAACSVKMVNQLLAGVHIAAAAEAMAFGARLGLNTRMLFEIIKHGGGYSWMFGNRVPHMLENDYTPYSAVDIFVKDLGIVSNESSNLKIPLHISNAAHQLFLSALSEKLYVIEGGCGAACSVKMVNQLLAGVHIAAAAEAMAFGARLGLNTRMLFEIIKHGGGYSWMFGNRVPHMLENDYTPYSAVDIFVKDLGIVSNESSNLKIPLHISNAAHQLFLSGSASGWGRYDDAAVIKVYETLTGVKVEERAFLLNKEDLLKSLPSEWPEDPLEDLHLLEYPTTSKVLVVLDDDPTGTQTVHDIEVLTECFSYIPFSWERNVDTAAKRVTGINYTEADAAVSVLGEMDAWIICPFFLQGGRYTINDIHYVADSDRLVPAGETEFSKDAAFGYKSSNLREWVEEKTKGRIPASSVSSISIHLLRKGGPVAICKHLCCLQKGSICIVNAASERDAEMKGKRFLCRTAASFVSARIGVRAKPPIYPRDLGITKDKFGGLIVVGSYVPKTTKQVEELKGQLGHTLRCIEVSVDKISMKSTEEREQEISHVAEIATASLKANKDTLLMTSRQLITGKY
ncbi:putative Ketose-bisphosphate aldolase class-II family protein [Cocos nucifera]|uniref:Putative Ketose-bisphosphate aldolase class-II family protein n=1 Tax=Cocos nucifera TaxID=13894 RepID=A0A8K0IGW9_COCNU|nr:putative Ketose-bisphosphate aldolase class-II family protein [Cocos nucifera]